MQMQPSSDIGQNRLTILLEIHSAASCWMGQEARAGVAIPGAVIPFEGHPSLPLCTCALSGRTRRGGRAGQPYVADTAFNITNFA
eukprot:1161182-Pelagomonas_calceolata.AAC.14